MDSQQLIFFGVTILVFILLGFMLRRSIKKYEARKAAQKKRTGRFR